MFLSNITVLNITFSYSKKDTLELLIYIQAGEK